MQEELDPNLQALFQEQGRKLTEEPFVSRTMKRIERQRLRQTLRHKTILVLALACCAFLSPLFIKGSILLSRCINLALEAFRGPLKIPGGNLTALLCGTLIIILFGRRLIYKLAYHV